MFNVTICFDELNQISILNSYLVKFSSSHNFKFRLTKFKSLSDLISKPPNNIDILLINIDLKDKKTIFDTYNKIKSLYNSVKIIFIPDIVDFMINGFSLKDFRYILKPFKYSSFEDEILLCVKDLDRSNDNISNKRPLGMIDGISTKSIFFIESNGSNCIISTYTQQFDIPYSIDILEKKLSSNNVFFRCHKDFLVNIKRISKFNKTFIIINSKTIPLSKDKFIELKNSLLLMLKIV